MAATSQRRARLERMWCAASVLPRCTWRMALALCSLSLLLGTSPGAAQPAEESSPTPYVTAEQVRAWRAQGQPVTFLDVREADEFHAGHIPRAINSPYEQVDRLSEQLPHDQPIVVYCIHSTHRAPAAATTLRRLGLANARILEGGLVAWQVAGGALQASDLAEMPKILPLTQRCSDKTRVVQ